MNKHKIAGLQPVNPDFSPMQVANMAFLIDRLHQDCSPLQFLRELTCNSIESILRGSGSGVIRWNVEEKREALTGEQKLCIIDTGIGMTGDEMVKYINHLSSSISLQSTSGNFGVGAKISAAPANPEGLVYLSWVDGQGYMIHLHRDANGQYGLQRFPSGEFWTRITDDPKPDIIKQHGTMVVLLGKHSTHNTAEPPGNVRMPRKWIVRYLNSRFFRFPEDVKVSAVEGWENPPRDQHRFLRTVTGMAPWLEANSQERGSFKMPLSDATAFWYIMKDDIDTDSGHFTPPGQVAALYHDELYEIVMSNAGYARLQSFGVIFGCERVVVYIHPDNESAVTANTARTALLIEGEQLDWAAYAAEFRDYMPQELATFQDQIGHKAKSSDHRAAIRERLKAIKELFNFGRYRPNPKGLHAISHPNSNAGGEPLEKGGEGGGGSGTPGAKGGRQGDLYALFTAEEGTQAEFINQNTEPEVAWVSIGDGSRAKEEMDDRAANYIYNSNLIKVNADFRVVTDMVERWEQRYANVPGAAGPGGAIEQVVREWFEQQLIETVMSAHALRKGGKWSTEEACRLWDENALTAAVLPRYHIDVSIKRTLGQKLGTLK
ncbi:hypothetical protein [Pseudomonas sp. HY13-MNA-CIBAN-0226]|uniref:hypothetical protein n=1 Tax=Pseudomonas sp. HY13-MNA-CIBAN-0226 TaxID=3140473 RepID=UPI0033285EEE